MVGTALAYRWRCNASLNSLRWLSDADTPGGIGHAYLWVQRRQRAPRAIPKTHGLTMADGMDEYARCRGECTVYKSGSRAASATTCAFERATVTSLPNAAHSQLHEYLKTCLTSRSRMAWSYSTRISTAPAHPPSPSLTAGRSTRTTSTARSSSSRRKAVVS